MHLTSEIAHSAPRQPACVVERQGEWYAGEIRQWRLRDGVRAAVVTYSTSWDRAYCELLPMARVRPLSTPDRVWEQDARRST